MKVIYIYIPNYFVKTIKKRELFLLVRPFYSEKGWVQIGDMFNCWGFDEREFKLTNKIEKSSLLLIPYSINHYSENKIMEMIDNYNKLCIENDIKGYGFIAGDYPKNYEEFKNITYFRMSGYRSKLSNRNQGFPAALTDQHFKIYKTKNIILRHKKKLPTVGFCGLASNDLFLRTKQNIKRIKDNLGNSENLFNNNTHQPKYDSAYERYTILKKIEEAKFIRTNFIFRNQYRGGAVTKNEINETTLEYYDNMIKSDYIFCSRGYGNFSIRLYETLMMGRIPIFLNTDCLLPFPELINWENHLIWIEWNQKDNITRIIKNFHDGITDQKFKEIQLNNRNLWDEILKPKWILRNLT
jgi:hypothetical protein